MTTQSAEPRPGSEIRASVLREISEPEVERARVDLVKLERETARHELIMRLTQRGIPVYADRIVEREFYRQDQDEHGNPGPVHHYVEAKYEHTPLTPAERVRLTSAYLLGQIAGRYARRLIDGTAGADLAPRQWEHEIREARRNPWRGDAASWPETTDPAVALTLAYAWKMGATNGEHAEQGSGELTPSPYDN